ncbi:MAG: electron transfer flavoprotein subunit beta/FixA family protein [Bacteroidales bacterium]|jgi:electron transfer flavoprotein beta subunit|nr:electron transfer flavoprotein subunit beta/FixA family protein [Bacteroidales bacterium]MEE1097985.1 electron transfer flavoprotein subunit beta/FixA family protein [Bacteroidales bacterium]
MSLKIVVLAKQVPDTRNVGKDAMTEEGTVNRAALPAIFNPEDLNALEMALHIKDTVPQTEVYVLTMGPVRAGEIIRQSLYRGADGGYVISDRKVAGSDTLATSYTISQGVKKLGKVDLVLAGRQAIDGDTAQVGPQTAEKLEMPQITYAEEVLYVDDKKIRIKRRLERGVEEVECAYPCMVTVGSSAPECRYAIAKQVMKYKNAMTEAEAAEMNLDCTEMFAKKPYLKIGLWNAADIEAEDSRLGLSGSPTKVKKIENVVLTAKESVNVEATEEGLDNLVKELIASHIIG